MDAVEKKLAALHLNQTNSPTPSGVNSRRLLQQELQDLRKTFHPPKPSRSRFIHLKEEGMSQQFWRSAFPLGHASSLIQCMKDVRDWTNPPDKDDTTHPTTTQVAQASANYLATLGTLPTRSSTTAAATATLLAELGKWGVEGSTSDKVGADILPEEVERVSANLPTGKAPGPDRIPNEFYKAFSNILAPLLTDAFNEMRAGGKLYEGFSDGYVTQLYKKGTRDDPRNYRPITLLNGDYKILTRILAKRMLDIATQFVSDDQIGFVPRTFIGESHMLIRLMQAHLEHIDEGGILLFLDLEKAFDRCSWSYMHSALRELRFTSPFTSWIEMFYCESVGTKRQVIANGFLSKPYRVRRGTAQGCPLSPLLFLVIVEGFTRLVNNDESLKGIEIGDLIKKISHFADDSIGCLRDEHQIPRFNAHIKTFCDATSMAETSSARR